MCGILGIIGGALPVTELVANSALDLLQHRGPDDRGVLQMENAWLGHRRLAIIDTGSGGHQPMVNQETGVALIFNGEIYNYIELREELAAQGYKFQSHSDTEVLLCAYLAWGQECIKRFNGMWSFLIWDPRINQAFFSRDRFGVKPFYYSLVRGRLSVASEPKALIAIYPELRKVDEQTLYRFLAKGLSCDSDRSFYAGINVLEPAHSGVFTPGWLAPKLMRYWDYPPASAKLADSSDLLERFQAAFDDAVRLRMRSDVPVGITLSGGLDSTAVLHASERALQSQHSELKAFTSVYSVKPGENRLDELKWAQLAIQPYSRVRLVEVSAESDWLPVLRRIIWHLDGPECSPAVFPLWKIMKTASRQKVPVLLEGQGADELLGGYVQYAALVFLSDLRKSVFRPGAKRIKQLIDDFNAYRQTFETPRFLFWLIRVMFPILKDTNRRWFGAQGTLRPEFVKKAMAGIAEGEPIAENQRQPLDRQLLSDFSKTILPGLLHYGDAVSMAHSIESRLPFMDYRLVELAFRLPQYLKVSNGETKRILREYLRKAGQVKIANRKDKIGYATPIDQWISGDGRAALRELLLSPDSRIAAYCEPEKIKRLLNVHAKGNLKVGNHIYRLLTAELWLRECAG